MAHIIQKIIEKYYYATESIKNRYPCKIIAIKNINSYESNKVIQYQAASRINIRTSTAQEILNDPLLVEKFHPTDGVKLGFLACGEILLNKSDSLEEAKELYLNIISHIFKDTIEKK